MRQGLSTLFACAALAAGLAACAPPPSPRGADAATAAEAVRDPLVLAALMVTLGEAETMKIMGEIVERLSKRFGDKLGRPAV